MSLLYLDSKTQLISLAKRIYDRQFHQDRQLDKEYDSRRKIRMLEDISYNIACLETAIRFEAPDIMVDYAGWIYQLLATRMSDIPRERVRDHLILHYQILLDELQPELEPHEWQRAKEYLQQAIEATEQAAREKKGEFSDIAYPDQQLFQNYFDALLQGNRTAAQKVIMTAVDDGTPLEDIYLHVFQRSMYEIGRLWHQGQITVDKEHYCTAVTQGVMSLLYPRIFGTKRVHRTIVACCVGNELHEMGARMVCDLFELHGWDTVYLGAALPQESILHALAEEEPDLLALSVTMPHHLNQCAEIIAAIKAHPRFQSIKLAVGGRAMQIAPHLATRWGVDVTTGSGVEFVHWANQNLLT